MENCAAANKIFTMLQNSKLPKEQHILAHRQKAVSVCIHLSFNFFYQKGLSFLEMQHHHDFIINFFYEKTYYRKNKVKLKIKMCKGSGR